MSNLPACSYSHRRTYTHTASSPPCKWLRSAPRTAVIKTVWAICIGSLCSRFKNKLNEQVFSRKPTARRSRRGSEKCTSRDVCGRLSSSFSLTILVSRVPAVCRSVRTQLSGSLVRDASQFRLRAPRACEISLLIGGSRRVTAGRMGHKK